MSRKQKPADTMDVRGGGRGVGRDRVELGTEGEKGRSSMISLPLFQHNIRHDWGCSTLPIGPEQRRVCAPWRKSNR